MTQASSPSVRYSGSILIPERRTDQASAVIRCSPDEDATNGFFVSCFARGNTDTELSHDGLKRKADIEVEDSEHKAKKKRPKKKKKKIISAGVA
jgi:putative methyltransferase